MENSIQNQLTPNNEEYIRNYYEKNKDKKINE